MPLHQSSNLLDDCCRQHTLRYRQWSAQASHCMKRCPAPGTAGNPAQRPHSAYWKEASGRGGGTKPRCAQPREGSRAVCCKLVWGLQRPSVAPATSRSAAGIQLRGRAQTPAGHRHLHPACLRQVTVGSLEQPTARTAALLSVVCPTYLIL